MPRRLAAYYGYDPVALDEKGINIFYVHRWVGGAVGWAYVHTWVGLLG